MKLDIYSSVYFVLLQKRRKDRWNSIETEASLHQRPPQVLWETSSGKNHFSKN